MAITLAQPAKTTGYSSSTLDSVTFGSACTPGSLIVVLVSDNENQTTTFTVSDGTNTYTNRGTQNGGSIPGANCQIFTAPNTSSSALTVSVTISPAGYGGIAGIELLGADSSPIDAFSSSAAAAFSQLSLTPTTNFDHDAIFVVGTAYPGGTLAHDTGYTNLQGPTSGYNCYSFAEYILDGGLSGAAATITYNASSSASGPSILAALAVKVASSNPALTGVAGTSATGALTPNISVGLTGLSGTSATGQIVDSDTNLLSGVVGTGATGTGTPNIDVSLTGIEGDAAAGTLGADLDVPITGAEADSATDNLGVDVTVELAGVEGASATGVIIAPGDITIALTGESGSGSVGTLVPVVQQAQTGGGGGTPRKIEPMRTDEDEEILLIINVALEVMT